MEEPLTGDSLRCLSQVKPGLVPGALQRPFAKLADCLIFHRVLGILGRKRIDKPSFRMSQRSCLVRLSRTAVFVLIVLSACRVAGQANGIFADFTTSLGNFSCVLDYTNAPKAVANFIGLASGQQAWLELPSGRARTNAFYDGLLFHRVIAGFMIQGGSPNGQGTDGPGYAFPDEFTPTLRFNSVGVLAMANSGPKSNGAQFFITVAATAWLNDLHTVFGWLVSGTNVVTAISKVAVDANSKPLTNVVIQRVAIRRVGTAAQNFNINAQSLPVVTNLLLKISNSGSQVALTFSNRLYADNRLYSTTNLSTWTPELLGIQVNGPGTNTIFRARDGAKRFYSLAQIQYASSTLAPKIMYGRTVVLTFSGGLGVITVTFDSIGGGTYTYPPSSPGTVTSYTWTQEPYRGRLWPIYFSDVVPMNLRLDYTSATGGSFTGTAYTSPSTTSVSGTFTMTLF
jgi:cyclophilin family peptidyl-prolyl cis-trans isomerase